MLNSQLKEIYIDAELDMVDTARLVSKINRKDFTIGAVPIEAGVDDPDHDVLRKLLFRRAGITPAFSDPELDKMIDRQSMEANPEKRKQIVWEIEKKLAEAAVRPVLFFPVGYSCWRPWVKNLNIMANSIYNGWRMEDVWLDKKS